MIRLAQLMRDHQDELIQRYASIMEPRHYHALRSIIDCHTPACGEVQYDCHDCSQYEHFCHACGNRSCPACQHQTNNDCLSIIIWSLLRYLPSLGLLSGIIKSGRIKHSLMWLDRH